MPDMFYVLNLRCCAFLPLLLLISLVFGGRAESQNIGEAARAAANLQPESRAIIQRLSGLRELPDGVWKLHAGNLAHGEAVDLDESDWQSVKPGAYIPHAAVWFRQTYRIPETLNGYDLTGARIWFKFNAGANGQMPQILYYNGRRVAMGDDLEPVVLLDPVKPGDKVTVAVKLLHTVDNKDFQGAELHIDFPANRPSPVDLLQEFLSAAVLTPSFVPGDASRLAALNSAVQAVDFSALDARDQAKFDASLAEAHRKLETLRPLLQQGTVHLSGNAHIDAAWLWPWTETVDVVKRTFGTALQLMYEYPKYTFTQSAAVYNEWVADKYPDMNSEIAQRIKEGRWEIVGGMWVEPDLNMPDGESLVRQLLVGKRWFKQAYGVDVRIGWNPDSFGYSWQLPQIYKKSGMDYFVTQKLAGNDTNKFPFKLFWWESPDGSKVLTYFPNSYVNVNIGPTRLSNDLASSRQRSPGMTRMMDLYGVGDHGGGPTRAILDEGFHWTEPGHVAPKYEFGAAQSFFTSVEDKIAPDSRVWDYASIAKGYKPPPAVPDKISIPTWNSELYYEYHRGVYTTQANHKRNMRESEEEVLDAEKWASLAWLDGKIYPGSEITEDWKKVLFNQFHDSAAGSGISTVYRDAQKDYDVVRWSTNEIKAGSLETLAERINTESETEKRIPIVIFNPLGWERSGDVTANVQLSPADSSTTYRLDDRNGESAHAVAIVVKRDSTTGVVTLNIPAVDVPALGYKVLWLDSAHGSANSLPQGTESESANSLVLENRSLRVAVDKTSGCITSLFDKRANFETLAAGTCGNELQAFKDAPERLDAWNIDPGTYNAAPALLSSTESVVGEGTSAIRITRSWQSSKFVQTISLGRDSNQVDVDNEIDWHERHVLLKAAFSLAAAAPFATYEIPYGSIDRPTTRNNSWEKAQFEVPALRWADLGDGKHGMSLLNQTKFGYDAVGNTLRLTLLRSPTWPDPEADQGHHHFHYALYPHSGTWKDALTVRHGYEYNYPLTAVVATAHAGVLPAEHSFASVNPENVVLTAVKKAEDANGLIFRVYEWAGKSATAEFHIPAGATAARTTNLMEAPEANQLAIIGSVVKVPIHPYEILSIRVDYPNGKPALQ
jgi:alpha-mannosidase